MSAVLGVVVTPLGRVGRCDRVERVAAAEVHILETVLDLVGHFRHVSGGGVGSAYEKIVLGNSIASKARSAMLGDGPVYL